MNWLYVAAVVALGGQSFVAQDPVPSSEIRVTDEWGINVFLCTPAGYGCGKRYATAAQRRKVESLLTKVPGVTDVLFVDRASAYA
ncbi:hypothetical protein SAMN05444920_104791 [Nonomuraea solani]|uniref:Uncharacterized protein n=1 Tax=Nonomuraea solani TaxID=1144553 RepID=A0A1H6D465_9ACTN|nr:hypothetical protein [Nonomuraea solani]SEG80051.1 hypothetical protein SAMN05444920_104791 [Nonomuraea solani]